MTPSGIEPAAFQLVAESNISASILVWGHAVALIFDLSSTITQGEKVTKEINLMTGDQKSMDSNYVRAQVARITIFLLFQNLCALCHTYFPKNFELRKFVVLSVCLQFTASAATKFQADIEFRRNFEEVFCHRTLP